VTVTVMRQSFPIMVEKLRQLFCRDILNRRHMVLPFFGSPGEQLHDQIGSMLSVLSSRGWAALIPSASTTFDSEMRKD
jgi:hypothetical protein